VGKAWVEVGEYQVRPAALISILKPYVTAARFERFKKVVNQRTNDVIPVLEGVYDRGNICAVMRSAEGLGVQKFHVIESSEKFKVANRVSKGADKWLDVFRWENSIPCVEYLKGQGVQICATSLTESRSIEEIDFTRPTAVVFGNEKSGISEQMSDLADSKFHVPMQGFVESFNISVAAAVTFYHIYLSRKEPLGSHGNLSMSQKNELLASYLFKSIFKAEEIVDKWMKNVRQNQGIGLEQNYFL